MSPVHPTLLQPLKSKSDTGRERGIVDLYAARMAMVAARQAQEQQDALEQIVVTQPFGRAFTAQPSFPPDPAEETTAIAQLRRKLAGVAPGPRRKLATS